jgi:hypothetical protein
MHEMIDRKIAGMKKQDRTICLSIIGFRKAIAEKGGLMYLTHRLLPRDSFARRYQVLSRMSSFVQAKGIRIWNKRSVAKDKVL